MFQLIKRPMGNGFSKKKNTLGWRALNTDILPIHSKAGKEGAHFPVPEGRRGLLRSPRWRPPLSGKEIGNPVRVDRTGLENSPEPSGS